MQFHTIEELEAILGESLRALRLQRNLSQAALAERAGIGVNTLKNLEGGKGGTLRTLLQVLRAFGKDEWVKTLAPTVSISPLHMVKNKPARERASPRRNRHGDEKK
jgi:transcriptional regulator with XRE-family HTH domain